MTEEFPESLLDEDQYAQWVSLLAENATHAAEGQAADAEFTGDRADSSESRIDSEIELEVDDKIDALASERTPYDILRLTNQRPSEDILKTLSSNMDVTDAALQLAHDALIQDVRQRAIDGT